MVAVLVATGASPAMTYTLKLLTDAAVACGQGQADAALLWRRALVFPAVYPAND